MSLESAPKTGGLFGLSDENTLLSSGQMLKQDQPKVGRYCYYSPDFYGEFVNPWFIFANNEIKSKKYLLSRFESKVSQKPGNEDLKIIWQSPSKDEFAEVFGAIKNVFSKKEANKIVPVVFEQVKKNVHETLLEQMLLKLFQGPKNQQIPYGLWQDGEGILGQTPEVLFEYDPKASTLTTMALAGTHATSEKDGSLLENKKEMTEHGLVVDSLKSSLSPLGALQVGATFEWNIGSLKHLRTDFSVELKGAVDIESLVKQLHPTPALGVNPRSYGWQNLKKFESKVDRKKYGAPFGLLHPCGKFQCVVAIRNVQWSQGMISLGSGCGIVEASELEKEWNELILKRNSVKTILGV